MDRAQQFRKASAVANRGRERHGWRYSETLQRLALEHWEERQRIHLPLARIAEELGVSGVTLGRWVESAEAEEEATRPVPRFREVRVEPSRVSSSTSVCVVTPEGLRIEGLDLAQAAELARVLR